MVKIFLINIRIYSNTNINKQTNFEYDFWPKVKALVYNETRASVVTELKSASFIALTSDMWSSVNMTPCLSQPII